MKSYKRCVRRYNNKIKIKRARRMLKEWNMQVKNAKRLYNNMKNCSCAMCCNERKSQYNQGLSKLTLSERRNLARLEEGMMDIL